MHKGKDTFEYVEQCLNSFQSFKNLRLEDKQQQTIFQNLFTIVSQRCPPVCIAPLIHYYNNFQSYRILDFFIKLDNMASSCWIVGTKDVTTRIFQILRVMDNEINSGKPNVQQIADTIIQNPVLDYDGHKEEDNQLLNQFVAILNEDNWGNASGSRGDKTVYILLKINLLLSDRYNKLEHVREQSSVEHIIPRTPDSKDWPNIDPESEIYENWIHKLGNLVLLNRRKNSSISNSSFKTKKEKYAEAIENNPHASGVFLKNEVWTLEKVQENHERVIKLLQRYYEGNSLQTLLNLHKR